MTAKERELQKAVSKAHKDLAAALEWCPDHYGAKDQLQQAFSLVDKFLCWFVQTHD